MIPINDIKDPNMHQMRHIRGMSRYIFTKIDVKQCEIACFLTCLTLQTCPAGRAMPHLPCIFRHVPVTGAYYCFINLENIYNSHAFKLNLEHKLQSSVFLL